VAVIIEKCDDIIKAGPISHDCIREKLNTFSTGMNIFAEIFNVSRKHSFQLRNHITSL